MTTQLLQTINPQSKRKLLTQGRLKSLIQYEPETGMFYWLEKRCASIKTPAGSMFNGRHTIWVDGCNHYAHRLAWLYVYGVWPEHEIDHINGDTTDNRIANLRDVSHAVNMQNQRRARRDNQSGLMGAQKNGSGWRAVIKIGNARKSLGTYNTPEEAHAVYMRAKQSIHPASGVTNEQ